MARQQVLYDRSKYIGILMVGAALIHPVCTLEVLAGQLDRLMSAIGPANVWIGIPAGLSPDSTPVAARFLAPGRGGPVRERGRRTPHHRSG
jgi:hypothetical protein